MFNSTKLIVTFGIWMAIYAGVENLVHGTDDDFHFGYDGDEGPDHWADHYGTCAGKHQSPINIEEHLVQKVQLLPLQFTGYDDIPESTTLTNNGHTVKLELHSPQDAWVSGGPLKAGYVFAQMHFHWGYNDTFGSEDLINNHSYPMELHVVSYKSEYDNDTEAGRHDDGLVVMAFFFQVSPTDNEDYSEVVAKLSEVLQPEQSVKLDVQRPLNAFLGSERTHFYTYHGSLTTPPCSEVVTWIDFTEPITLSHDQLEQFRKLQTKEGPMTHNNRPTQPLGDRLVWYNERNRDPNQPETDETDETGRRRNPATRAVSLTSLIISTLAACFVVNSYDLY